MVGDGLKKGRRGAMARVGTRDAAKAWAGWARRVEARSGKFMAQGTAWSLPGENRNPNLAGALQGSIINNQVFAAGQLDSYRQGGCAARFAILEL